MTSCYPRRRMRWSGVTDAIARCKNRSIGYARKPRSAHAWRWTCGEKPKRQGATKPSTPYMRHVLPEATRYPCYSLRFRQVLCATNCYKLSEAKAGEPLPEGLLKLLGFMMRCKGWRWLRWRRACGSPITGPCAMEQQAQPQQGHECQLVEE